MTVVPVIVRELRAEARHAFNYWLRVLGALSLLTVAVMIWWNQDFGIGRGGRIFGDLNMTLFFAIWILVPLLTADCLSREKREGTLGLLFLTPLNAKDIVLAKGLVHGVRSLTLLLSALPVLMLPFLMGGVGWKECVLAVMVNLSSALLALGAGLLASSRSKQWMRALMLAEILGFLFLVIFGAVYAQLALGALQSSSWAMMGVNDLSPLAFVLCTDIRGLWAQFLSGLSPGQQMDWLKVAGSMLALSFLVLTLIIFWTARRLKRSWQEEPPSARQLWWYKIFCTPQFGLNFYRRFMRRSLERNPIGWLQKRTWSARITTWSWCGVLVSMYSLIFVSGIYGREMAAFHIILASLLSLNMAFSAAGSFRRERETGALELILVSPLSVRQIIWGRLRGIRDQFFPAIVMLMALWLYVSIDMPRLWATEKWEWFGAFCFFVTTFLTVPVVGLYCSLRYQNFFVATFLTLGVTFAVPWFILVLIEFAGVLWANLFGLPNLLPTMQVWRIISLCLVCLCQIWLALIAEKQLNRRLTNRTFAFQRGG